MPLQQGVSACAGTGDVINHGEVVLMANTEGLQKTLEHIKGHPKEWDQYRWHTCFAGVALQVLRGAVVEDDEDWCCELLKLDGRVLNAGHIGDMADAALDLTREQAYLLFHAGNTLEDLERLVAEFTAEAPVPA